MKKFEEEIYRKRLAEQLSNGEKVENAKGVVLEDGSNAASDGEDDDFMDLVKEYYPAIVENRMSIRDLEIQIKKETEKKERLRKKEQYVWELFMTMIRFIEELEAEAEKDRGDDDWERE